MSNSSPNVATRFAPGNKMGGRTAGARSRLSEQFFEMLRDDFDAHGMAAIVNMRANDPSGYIAMVARLMPKELEAKLAIQTAVPGNLSPEQWRVLCEIADMVQSITPPGTSDDAVKAAIEHGLRSQLARPLPELEILPSPLPPLPY